jgi:hypothetical protein
MVDNIIDFMLFRKWKGMTVEQKIYLTCPEDYLNPTARVILFQYFFGLNSHNLTSKITHLGHYAKTARI